MRIEVADSTGCPSPQFVVHAETELDRVILKMFLNFPSHAKNEWKFHLHGITSSVDLQGITSFNFGYIENKPSQIVSKDE